VLDLDPYDTVTRWTLIDNLLSRGEIDAAWEELCRAPEPLDPADPAQARLWIHLNVRYGSSETTVATCLRLMRRFADNEDFCHFATTNLIVAVTTGSSVHSHLMDEVRGEIDRFFERWPHTTLQAIPNSDATQLMAKLDELTRPSEEQLRELRYVLHGVLTGTAPLSRLTISAKRSYAEILIHRGVSVIPARHPDPTEHAACLAAAAVHADADTVLDLTTAVVLGALPERLRDAAIGAFARVMTTNTVMMDALSAREALALRSTSSIRYDAERGRSVVDEITKHEADRLAVEADDLLRFIRSLNRLPRPASHVVEVADFQPLRAWISPADLAQHQQILLWSDDPLLRLVARRAGVPTTSTPAVLQHLLERGDITGAEHEGAVRTLIRARIGDFPLYEDRLFELAEEDAWQPYGVAQALGRPATWQTPSRTMNLFSRLVIQIRARQAHTLPDWLYLAVKGATAWAASDSAATEITARLMAIAMDIGRADAAQAVSLTMAARMASVQAANPDHPARPDPLPLCMRLIRDVYAERLPPDLAMQLAMSLVSAHSSEDRLAVIEELMRI
jgi:hypothetical protein